MPINISITSKGFEHIHNVLNSLASMIENPDEKCMQRLGAVVLDDIDKRFMTRGYGTWAPLSPRTIKRKGHDFVLIDTGIMFNSAQITKLTRGMVSVGVLQGGKNHNPDIPEYHQEGTKRMPQRKIIDVTPKLKEALVQETAHWVADMVKAAQKEV